MTQKIKEYYAKYYYQKHIGRVNDYEDFLQEAELAELKAIQNYKEDKGDFTPYLIQTIKNELLKKSLKDSSSVSIKSNAVLQGIEILRLENQGYDLEYILQTLNISSQRYALIKNALGDKYEASDILVYKSKPNDFCLADLFIFLDHKEQNLLEMYMAGYSILEIANRFEKSYESIRQKFQIIFKKVREHYVK